VSGNAAFDAAMAAGGAIDTATGIPKSREEMFAYYSYIRDQARDAESKAGAGGLEMPAGYMFKDVPKWEQYELGDPVDLLLAEMDRHGIVRVVTGVEDPNGARAVREHPDRFAAAIHVDPNHGTDEVRKIDRFAGEWDLKCVGAFPAGLHPQVAVNDKKWFPIYGKCVDLDLTFGSTMGVPGPRIPFAPQDVAHLDEVCWYFPELRFVTRHGCEPWTDLAVKLMLKWPNLYYSTTAFAPKYYPVDVVHFANTRGADKIIWSGYFPAGLTYDRIFAELPAVPFRDHVWPKFLHENATRVFKL
jgi:predicted TIM-barrel fold metal-dependent hydrolase